MAIDIRRGEIWWHDFSEPEGSEPGGSRPVMVLQGDNFNRSRIETVVVVVITGNLGLAAAPGNVWISASDSGLQQDSVVNVSQMMTTDKAFLRDRVGSLSADAIRAVGRGVALVLGLPIAD